MAAAKPATGSQHFKIEKMFHAAAEQWLMAKCKQRSVLNNGPKHKGILQNNGQRTKGYLKSKAYTVGAWWIEYQRIHIHCHLPRAKSLNYSIYQCVWIKLLSFGKIIIKIARKSLQNKRILIYSFKLCPKSWKLSLRLIKSIFLKVYIRLIAVVKTICVSLSN